MGTVVALEAGCEFFHNGGIECASLFEAPGSQSSYAMLPTPLGNKLRDAAYAEVPG